MMADVLAELVEKFGDQGFVHEDADNDCHRAVLAALMRGFDHPAATLLGEPSLAGSTSRPPEAVVVNGMRHAGEGVWPALW